MSELPKDLTVQGQNFTETYSVPTDVRIKGGALIHQPVFHLTEGDWAYLTYAKSIISGVPSKIFLVAAGGALTLIAKQIYRWFSPAADSIRIEPWEWLVPVIAHVIAAIAGLFIRLLPNESKRVKSDIDEFFRESRRR